MRKKLTKRISIDDIHEICFMAQGERNDGVKAKLYDLTFDEDERVALNALWTFSHFDQANNEWLYAKHDDLINRVLIEKNTSKLRIMLSLLLRQPFEVESLRSDFIDFCESKITACSQPYAIRAYCMKLAYEQMKYYPELLAELKATLDMLSQEPLSPALQSAKNQVMKKIKKNGMEPFTIRRQRNLYPAIGSVWDLSERATLYAAPCFRL